jgi:hypothetical protein
MRLVRYFDPSSMRNMDAARACRIGNLVPPMCIGTHRSSRSRIPSPVAPSVQFVLAAENRSAMLSFNLRHRKSAGSAAIWSGCASHCGRRRKQLLRPPLQRGADCASHHGSGPTGTGFAAASREAVSRRRLSNCVFRHLGLLGGGADGRDRFLAAGGEPIGQRR